MKHTTRDGLDRYADHHVPTGSFLKAVLDNDLRRAVFQADDDNLRDLREIVMYAHWELPGACWGSPEAVRAWLEQTPPTEYVIKVNPLRGDRTISGSPRPYFFRELDRPMTDRIQELEAEIAELKRAANGGKP